MSAGGCQEPSRRQEQFDKGTSRSPSPPDLAAHLPLIPLIEDATQPIPLPDVAPTDAAEQPESG